MTDRNAARNPAEKTAEADQPPKPKRPGEATQFKPGNPGKPKGARSATTKAAEILLDGEAEELTRVAIERAKAGDSIALRLCLDRIIPPRKDRPVSVRLPKVTGLADLPAAQAALLNAVSSGDVTPGEAANIAAIFESYRRSIETADLDARLKRMEENLGR